MHHIQELNVRELPTRQLPLVGSTAGETLSTATGRQRQRIHYREAHTQTVGEPSRKGISATVGVHCGAWQFGRIPCAAPAASFSVGTAARAVGEHDELGIVLRCGGLSTLDRIVLAQHESI